MHIAYDREEQELRDELRAYYAELLDPATVSELAGSKGVGSTVRRLVRRMGADGWLGIGWPTEFGGKGRTAVEQFIFFDESMRAGAPVPMIMINSVAPTLMEYGNDEQKAEFLPKILGGEVHFCVGYSEPEAGSDLASLRTRAVRDGDEWIISGQKMWTSLASDADYCWRAARTGEEGARHKGISIFIVPMDAPGIERTELDLLVDHDLCAVHYDDVRIAAGALVGEENRGWRLITSQLNHERVTLCSPGMAEHTLHEVTSWAKANHLPDGRRIIDQEWVQLNLARAYAGFEYLRLLNWRIAWAAAHDELPVADASSIKVFGTEHYLSTFRLLMEIVGERVYLVDGSPGAIEGSRLEDLYRGLVALTFAGGANELQRDLIATFGAGMPMATR